MSKKELSNVPLASVITICFNNSFSLIKCFLQKNWTAFWVIFYIFLSTNDPKWIWSCHLILSPVSDISLLFLSLWTFEDWRPIWKTSLHWPVIPSGINCKDYWISDNSISTKSEIWFNPKIIKKCSRTLFYTIPIFWLGGLKMILLFTTVYRTIHFQTTLIQPLFIINLLNK